MDTRKDKVRNNDEGVLEIIRRNWGCVKKDRLLEQRVPKEQINKGKKEELMWEGDIPVIMTFIMASATAGMFVVSYLNFRLLQKIENKRENQEKEHAKKEQEFREQISDLYRAIAISNLLSGNSDLDLTRKKFCEEYKGKTKISL